MQSGAAFMGGTIVVRHVRQPGRSHRTYNLILDGRRHAPIPAGHSCIVLVSSYERHVIQLSRYWRRSLSVVLVLEPGQQVWFVGRDRHASSALSWLYNRTIAAWRSIVLEQDLAPEPE